ncbi:MAG TPA: phospholipase D-like domain-containing protein, partial [Kiritimatiellia bacterium]|nr:phospholipase D-like domain-containing protein [Kiritimatiellia bacterium]
IFDMRWVVTGSYNFTTTAQVSNWENLVWVDSPDMAEQYKQAWDAIVSDEVVEPRAEKTAAPKNPRPPKRRNIDGGAGAGLVFREDWRHADPGTEPA